MRDSKKAILNVAIFILIIGCISLPLIHSYRQYCMQRNNYYENVKHLDGQYNLLFAGASYGYRAFIPEIMDQNCGTISFNTASEHATLKNRYFILKQFIDRNPVEYVVLDLSLNALTERVSDIETEGDIRMLEKLIYPIDRLEYELLYMKSNTYNKYLYWMLNRGYKLWGRTTNISVGEYQKQGFGFGLEAVEQSEYIDGMSPYHTLTRGMEIQDQSVKYLEKIIELCEDNNIKLMVVGLPIVTSCEMLYSDSDNIYNYCKDLLKKHDVDYYDFNLYKKKDEVLFEDSSFFDVSHLSQEGAIQFSNEFSLLFNEWKSGNSINEYFYDNYLEFEDMMYRSKNLSTTINDNKVIIENKYQSNEKLQYAWYVYTQDRQNVIYKQMYGDSNKFEYTFEDKGVFYVCAYIKNDKGFRRMAFTDKIQIGSYEDYANDIYDLEDIIVTIEENKVILKNTYQTDEDLQYAWYVCTEDKKDAVYKQMYTSSNEFIYEFNTDGKYYICAYIRNNKNEVKSIFTDMIEIKVS